MNHGCNKNLDGNNKIIQIRENEAGPSCSKAD